MDLFGLIMSYDSNYILWYKQTHRARGIGSRENNIRIHDTEMLFGE